MRKITLMRTVDEFMSLKPVWNGVVARSDADMPFMTFEWFEFWWKMFGPGNEMLIFVVKEAETIVGIVPCIRKKSSLRGMPVTMISLMANYYSVRAAMAVTGHGRIFRDILAYMRDNGIKYDVIAMDMIVAGSATDLQIRDALAEGTVPYRKMRGEESPYIPITGSWDGYINSRSAKFRQNIARTRRQFENHGDYQVTQYTGEGIYAAIDEMLHVSRHTWKYQAGTAIANSEKRIAFFSELAHIAARAGWLRLWILKLHGQPVAFRYCLQYRDTLYSIKIGYHAEHAKLSPGEFLKSLVVEHAFTGGIKEVDTLGAREADKMNWTSAVRPHMKYWIYGDTIKGAMLRLTERYIVDTVKKIRRIVSPAGAA